MFGKNKDKKEELPQICDIQAAKKELDELKSVLMVTWPFLANLLRRVRIIVDPKTKTAKVNTRNEMRVNPAFMATLIAKAKLFVYCHETLHLAFDHPQRMAQGEMTNFKAAQYAADSVVDHILFTHGFEGVTFPFPPISPELIASMLAKAGKKIGEKEIAKLSFEEQYRLIEPLLDKSSPFNGMNDVSGGGGDPADGDADSGSGDSDGEPDEGSNGGEKDLVIQEGDEAAGKEMTSEEMKKYWQEALIQAAIQAKLAGKFPAELERILDDLLKSKVDWKAQIKKQILDWMGKMVISTWKRVSRKHALLPGHKHVGKPNVWCLTDASGSIGEEILKQFFGEIYGIIRNQGRGVIIPWDAKAYDPIELKRVEDLVLSIRQGKVRGGGGTMIAPVLRAVLVEMKPGDAVVVLTDGEIFDLGEDATQNLLRQVAGKSSCSIFGTMKIEVRIPSRWRMVKIEL